MHITVLVIYYLIHYCHSFIIPNELPSILSIVYSNIPPVKVGLDTRFGLGFRLGPHADFQTLVEIGPQTNTNSISLNGTISKRQSNTLNRLHRLYEISKKDFGKSEKGGNKEKESERTLVGQIEFKKVPGIDDFNDKKIKKKVSKNNVESLPTRFVLF